MTSKIIKERFTLRLPISLKEQLEQEACRTGISLNALIIMKLSEKYQYASENHIKK